MALIFLFPQGGILEERVSYSSHAIGFIIGVILGVSYYFYQQEKFLAKEVWIEVWPSSNDELLDFLSQNQELVVEEQEAAPL
ncbi:MAG TPA: hypothetical protein VNJ01_00995 [Bacteriovoracaceae bacterium]|nr:hypothetical protein [Bacteriovoracaceae bacterium]